MNGRNQLVLSNAYPPRQLFLHHASVDVIIILQEQTIEEDATSLRMQMYLGFIRPGMKPVILVVGAVTLGSVP